MAMSTLRLSARSSTISTVFIIGFSLRHNLWPFGSTFSAKRKDFMPKRTPNPDVTRSWGIFQHRACGKRSRKLLVLTGDNPQLQPIGYSRERKNQGRFALKIRLKPGQPHPLVGLSFHSFEAATRRPRASCASCNQVE